MTTLMLGAGANASRLHSGFWGTCPMEAIRNHLTDGFFFFDDFMTGGAAESSTAFTWQGGTPLARYLAHGTASSLIKMLNAAADDEIGVLTLDADADDDESYVTMDSTYSCPYGRISDTAGEVFRTWFEARVRFSNIASATAMVGKMIGLRHDAAAASLDIANGGASIAVAEFVGFRALSGDGDGMDAIYMDTAEAVFEEAADNAALVIVADTWYKFGIFFDGTNIRWYVDGEEILTGTKITPATTQFPDAEPLKPFFGCRLDGSDTANHADMDWWSFAQHRGGLSV